MSRSARYCAASTSTFEKCRRDFVIAISLRFEGMKIAHDTHGAKCSLPRRLRHFGIGKISNSSCVDIAQHVTGVVQREKLVSDNVVHASGARCQTSEAVVNRCHVDAFFSGLLATRCMCEASIECVRFAVADLAAALRSILAGFVASTIRLVRTRRPASRASNVFVCASSTRLITGMPVGVVHGKSLPRSA